MSDKLIRATSADNTVSIVFCNMLDTCKEAISLHGLKGIAAETLCRGLVGVALLSSTLKNKEDIVSLIIKGKGPAQGITATATQKGTVKGFLKNPEATGDTVGELLGKGLLTVTKDLGMKEPYTGQLPLVTGEIAEDITAYFAESEQIPSSCGIGVRFDDNGNLIAAAGFLIQLLPEVPYYVIDELEIDLARHPSPAELVLKYGNDYEKILISLLPSLHVQILKEQDIRWKCDCSKDKIEKALITIGKDELEQFITDGENAEIVCDFCNKKYNFTPQEIQELKDRI